MDVDVELFGILVIEIMLEINCEVVDWINYLVQVGKFGMILILGFKVGVFDFQELIDICGVCWVGEFFKVLLFQIDKEVVEIVCQIGCGEGNFIIVFCNVVNVLVLVDIGIFYVVQGLVIGFNIDIIKLVFVGVLGGKYCVYIDQYVKQDYFIVGYKGLNEMDVGIYYVLYVVLILLCGFDLKNF